MRPVKSKESKLDDLSNMSGIRNQTDDNMSDIFQNDPNFQEMFGGGQAKPEIDFNQAFPPSAQKPVTNKEEGDEPNMEDIFAGGAVDDEDKKSEEIDVGDMQQILKHYGQ